VLSRFQTAASERRRDACWLGEYAIFQTVYKSKIVAEPVVALVPSTEAHLLRHRTRVCIKDRRQVGLRTRHCALVILKPGRPMDTGGRESSNGRFREECLNDNAGQSPGLAGQAECGLLP
jgi:hypothetical protein